MGYKVFLQIEKDEDPILVHEFTDRRVRRVGLSGESGEAGALGVAPGDTCVTLTFDFASRTGAPTLEDLDAITHPTEMTGDDVAERQANLDSLATATNGPGVEPVAEADDSESTSGADDVTFNGLGDLAPEGSSN
jgi:hypothetical protein